MNSKILVATHKPYNFPENAMYTPIQVGKILSNEDFGYLGDDSGENISDKNGSYSELTALYWAWKNDFFVEYDTCGLVHYRRYFEGSEKFGKFEILSNQDIENILSEHDVIVPKNRKYYIETIYSHYKHAHHIKDLDTLFEVIGEYSPEYLEAFNSIMEQRSLHLFNMFVMKKEYFDSYCQWLFDILFELEKRIDISSYDPYQRRVFGFLSERMFNIWLLYNGLVKKELKTINIEGENLPLKALGMLKRRFGHL